MPTFTALPAATAPLTSLGTHASPEALAAAGYADTEYLVSGTAALWGPGRPQAMEGPTLSRAEIVPLGALRVDGLPYVTRAIVRAPVDPVACSGTVHVEVIHNAGEIVPSWSLCHRRFVDHGDVWIAVTVSSGAHVGIDGEVRGGVQLLRQLDPDRYGTLVLESGEAADWPLLRARDLAHDLEGKGLVDVLADSPFGGGGDSAAFGVLVEEIYRTYAHSPEVVAQIAASVREGDGPLAGYRIERLFGTGASGTAIWWNAFLDGGHHARARRDDGGPVFDGYVVFVASPPRTRPDDAVLVSVLSEAEAVLAVAEHHSPEDSDRPPFRQYELAGTGHRLSGDGSRTELTGATEALVELMGGAGERPDDLLPFDRVTYPVVHAIWDHLERWVADGVPMPPGAHLTRDPSTPDGLARDEHGNALGGVRTPWVEVPNARYLARSPWNPLRACMQPFPAERMRELYGDHATYVARFGTAVAALVADGWATDEEVDLFAPGEPF